MSIIAININNNNDDDDNNHHKSNFQLTANKWTTKQHNTAIFNLIKKKHFM